MKINKNIDLFIANVESYCEYLENLTNTNIIAFLHNIQLKLINLYSSVIMLSEPNDDLITDDDNDFREYLPENKIQLISNILGKYNLYKLIFDPYDLDDENDYSST